MISFKQFIKEMTDSGDIAPVEQRLGGDPKEAKKKCKDCDEDSKVLKRNIKEAVKMGQKYDIDSRPWEIDTIDKEDKTVRLVNPSGFEVKTVSFKDLKKMKKYKDRD